MKRIIMLTGAPISKSPVELHVFMQVIRPDLMPEFVKFANRYCDPMKKQDGIHYNGASFTEELMLLFNKRIAFRNQRDDINVVEKLPKV